VRDACPPGVDLLVPPTVSIILSGYNQRPFVEGAIDSALGQTYPHVELVIVDNGSTDGSQALLKNYGTDPRVRLRLHAANGPVTQRLNDAINAASGDFISILYADDFYLPHKLERQLEEFSKLPPDYGVVYSPGLRLDAATGRQWLDQSLKSSGAILKDMFRRHEREGFINPISPLMRKSCFVDYPFHEDLFVEGESIFLRFALTYKFQYVDEPLSVMREHSSNMGKAVIRNTDVAIASLDKLVQDRSFPPDAMPDLLAFRGSLLARCGWLGIRMAEDPRWARACVVGAIQAQPKVLLRPRTLATFALSSLPTAAIRLFNRALNARDHKETVAFKADYT
jgi:glycosyltransferase involved in cell wall biosynthesis